MPTFSFNAKPESPMPESLVIGVKLLDEQHLALFSLLTHFQKFHSEEISSELASELLSQLGAEIEDHFATEENFMKQSAMPEAMFDAHFMEHTRIIEEYVNLLQAVVQLPNLKIGEALALIENWIVQHVTHFDLQIRDYA